MKLSQLIRAHQRANYECNNTQQTRSENPALCFCPWFGLVECLETEKLTTFCDFSILPSKKSIPHFFLTVPFAPHGASNPSPGLRHQRRIPSPWSFSRMCNARQKVKTNLMMCLHLVSSKGSIGFSLKRRLKLKEGEKTKPKHNCQSGRVRCSLTEVLVGWSQVWGGDNGHCAGKHTLPTIALSKLLCGGLGAPIPASHPGTWIVPLTG